MLQIGKEKTMSVKEVAEILGVTDEGIKWNIRKLFPDLMKNGVETRLTEQQIADIKKIMIPTSQLVGAKLEIEMQEKAIEVMQWMSDKLKTLQAENETLKPKAINYDAFMSTDGFQTMEEVAKLLGIGRNTMMKTLRGKSILRENNLPYQNKIGNGFKVVENVKNNFKVCSTVVNSNGIEYIKKVLGI